MFSPSTKEELQSAVDLWYEKQNEALEKYGDNWLKIEYLDKT